MFENTYLAYIAQHAWLRVSIGVLASALAGWLAYGIIASLVRRAAKRANLTETLLIYTRRPGQLVLASLLIHVALQDALFDIEGIAWLRHGVAILVIVAVTAWVMRASQAVAHVVEECHPLNGTDNLRARRVQTQVRVLARTAMFVVGTLGAGSVLMTFPNVRQIGASLLASAGVAGIVAGLAARPVLGNMIAGLQIALTQPIRLDDVLVVENEWGRVEEISATYVVVRLWDDRRLIVPLEYFIRTPFQNWTRRSSDLIGSIFFWVDFRMPLAPLRDELKRICASAPEWDKRVCVLQVTDVSERAMQLRALISTQDASSGWELRCRVREELITFMQQHHVECLPTIRSEWRDESTPPRSAREQQPTTTTSKVAHAAITP